MALVGNCFYNISSIDPGTGFPGYFWLKTDLGTMWIRNSADTAWVLVGDSNQPYLGQLSTQGGNMNGAITGAHGLSTAATNNFTSSLYLSGDAVTTKIYVDNQIAALNAAIAASVSSALASVTTINLAARVARLTGSQTFVGTGTLAIPSPTYSDGTVAPDTECIWGAYLSTIQFGQYVDKNDFFTITQVGTSRSYNITAHRGSTSTDYAINETCIVSWFIIGFRSS